MPAVCPGRQMIRSQTAEDKRLRALAIDRTLKHQVRRSWATLGPQVSG
jgi:hypothetical protein